MPPKGKRSVAKFTEDDGFVDKNLEPKNKRSKSNSSLAQKETGKKFKDGEGNAYWELGGRLRRVTLSKFKGKVLVNIREHYEKDGKVLPSTKGISLTIEQFQALLSALPQIESTLAEDDVDIIRPDFSANAKSKEMVSKDDEDDIEEDEDLEDDERDKENNDGMELNEENRKPASKK